MSLETWKAEFYPQPACEVSAEDAVQHALTKWVGLRKDNLERHEVASFGGFIQDKSGRLLFWIDDVTCSLCQLYRYRGNECGHCPLAKVRGGVTCVEEIKGREAKSPYMSWYGRDRDPELMIAALVAAKKYEEDAAMVSGGGVAAGNATE